MAALSPPRRRARRVSLGARVALLLAVAAAPPAAARTLRVGVDVADLPAALTAARDGDVIELGGRHHEGQITLTRRVTLRGPGRIDGQGRGHAITVAAAGAVVEDLDVQGSGSDLQRSDSCVYLQPTASRAQVRRLRLRGCTFGIYVQEGEDAEIVDNDVEGSARGQRSLRGNGIHLFDATRATVRGNVVRGGRDGIYIGATEHSVIEQNRSHDNRFGVHYMFSWHNTLRGNVASGCATGFAIMQSHHIRVVANTAQGNTDHGILFRDATDSAIVGNRAIGNGEGLFFFSSTSNEIRDNHVLHNGVGAKVWAGSRDNVVRGNVFVGNRRQVFYVAATDLRWGTDGPGNLWGDAIGWDQDGDGISDRPYRVDSFSAHLLYRFPQAALLLRSPALELLATLAEKMPLFRVPTIVDERPLMRQLAAGGPP